MCKRYKGIIHTYLQAGSYSIIKNHINFFDMIDQEFDKIIRAQLGKVEERWHQDIIIYSSYVPLGIKEIYYLYVVVFLESTHQKDITVKSIVSLLANPMENTVLTQEHYHLANPFKDVQQRTDVARQGTCFLFIYLSLKKS